MNTQKKQLIIVGILGVVLVGVLAYQLTRSAPGPADTGKVDVAAAKTSAVGAKKTAKTASAGADKTKKEEDELNIAELLEDIEAVDFVYEHEKTARNVMAPLLGVTPTGGVGPEASIITGKEVDNFTMMDLMQKVVSGIMWDEVRPLAVVDDEVVYPGFEYVYGDEVAVVESIEQDHVTFRFQDALIQVPLKEQ